MVERIKSRKGVGQKPKYLLFLEALNRIYRSLQYLKVANKLQRDSVTVIKIVINADYLGFFLISYNVLQLGEVADFERQMFNLAQMFIRNPKLDFSIEPAILPNCCYAFGLLFNN